MDRTGNRPDPRKVQAVQDTPQPKTTSQLKGLLRLSRYYRAYHMSYAQMVHPLTELTNNGADVVRDWTSECDAAFSSHHRLANAPIPAKARSLKNFQPASGLAAQWSSGNTLTD